MLTFPLIARCIGMRVGRCFCARDPRFAKPPARQMGGLDVLALVHRNL